MKNNKNVSTHISIIFLISILLGVLVLSNASATCSGSDLQCDKIAETVYGSGASTLCENIGPCTWDSAHSSCQNIDIYVTCEDVQRPTCASVNCEGCIGDDTRPCVDGIGNCQRTGTQTRTCAITAGTWSDWETCSATAAVPPTCTELGKDCGTVSDGCGDTLDCGTCTSPKTCGANNICSCTPTTCAAQSKTCGTVSDGCGGTLTCGGLCTAPAPAPAPAPTPCGDGVIECVVNGWHTLNATWFLSNGYLAVNGTGIVTIYSEPFDLIANKNYTFSFNIKNTAFREINVTLDNYCFNASNALGPCGISAAPLTILTTDNVFNYNFTTYNISNNSNSVNNVYFRSVRIKITSEHISGDSVTPSIIANISFKETVPSFIFYNSSLVPSYDNSKASGCCPSDYCWDGSQCVNNSAWTNNASYPPLWNTLLMMNWTNNHVNTTKIPFGVGYRCVNYTGSAVWTLSYLKYDWNYVQSGYCANNSDCFVSYDADYSSHGGKSIGCLPNNNVVDDNAIFGQGNHYCYFGNWTTKSYLVAKQLQNISSNKNYVMQCYDNSSILYNRLNLGSISDVSAIPTIMSACVLIQQTPGVHDEQVITGIVLNDNTNGMADFIGALNAEYSKIYPLGAGSVNCDAGTAVGNFTKCTIDSSNLQVYYENNYKYFLISNKVISGLNKASAWETIVNFFKGLFSAHIETAVYDSISYTSSYDKIYLIRNGTMNVTSIEESKYDEKEQRVVNVLYINYVGTNQSTNPILDYKLNKTITEMEPTPGLLQMNYTNTTDNIQNLIIKTNTSTGLWPYLTNILRNRPAGYP